MSIVEAVTIVAAALLISCGGDGIPPPAEPIVMELLVENDFPLDRFNIELTSEHGGAIQLSLGPGQSTMEALETCNGCIVEVTATSETTPTLPTYTQSCVVGTPAAHPGNVIIDPQVGVDCYLDEAFP